MDPKRQSDAHEEPEGPFRAEHLTPGRYELVNGHPAYQAATGGDGASRIVAGVQALASDPDAAETGVDPGYILGEKTVRAPDIAVGNVPDAFGFIQGAPRLAVEYAGEHQDEVRLQDKIRQFLARGTELVWVVRLIGPRRVEVYQRNKAVTLFGPGQSLIAPGILREPVPVEAMFDTQAAQVTALRNFLAREGYSSLEDVKQEGREEVYASLRRAILDRLDGRRIERSEAFRSQLERVIDPQVLAETLVRAGECASESDLVDGLSARRT
ncbi:MAG: Uma2 family endonuclease [Deltaproteobacteria bacterium]|nr:Uma2 family endonuclease [Deltaproteobacteria bacterium]